MVVYIIDMKAAMSLCDESTRTSEITNKDEQRRMPVTYLLYTSFPNTP